MPNGRTSELPSAPKPPKDVRSKTLLPLIRKQVQYGSVVCSDTWRSYTGIASKGYVHRIVEHGEGQYSNGAGNHINGFEGFWGYGYLKRKLAAKGAFGKSACPFT